MKFPVAKALARRLLLLRALAELGADPQTIRRHLLDLPLPADAQQEWAKARALAVRSLREERGDGSWPAL